MKQHYLLVIDLVVGREGQEGLLLGHIRAHQETAAKAGRQSARGACARQNWARGEVTRDSSEELEIADHVVCKVRRDHDKADEAQRDENHELELRPDCRAALLLILGHAQRVAKPGAELRIILLGLAPVLGPVLREALVSGLASTLRTSLHTRACEPTLRSTLCQAFMYRRKIYVDARHTLSFVPAKLCASRRPNRPRAAGGCKRSPV